MIVVLKPGASEEKCREFENYIHNSLHLDTQYIQGKASTVLGILGDTSEVDLDGILAKDIVESVKRIQEPFKAVSRHFQSEDTVVDVDDVKIGGGNFEMMAGPCSVESLEQLMEIAENVKAAGAKILRAGAFKPRTSPYTFQGLGKEGLKLLKEVKKETGLRIVTEIPDRSSIDMFEDVDILQVGARNMQNFALLKELGKIKKPVLLKRGLSNTIDELLMSAEYIMSGGNNQVILCERGIRTFETSTRNTLDISAIPVIKAKSHLPIIIDPSHATGNSDYVRSVSLAAVAAGADGLIVEVHNDPSNALCDGQESITPDCFKELVEKITKIREII